LEEEQDQYRLEDAKRQLSGVDEKLSAKKIELQQLSETTIHKLHEIAELQAEQDKRRGRVEHLQGRCSRAEEENRAYAEDIVKLEEEIGRLLAEDKQLRRLFTEAEMKYYGEEERKRTLQVKVDLLQSEIIELRTDLERRSAKIEFLKGLIESREGLSDGVKFLASVGDWGAAQTMTVADVAVAESKFRAAVESALGESGTMVIVKTPPDADRAIMLLKREERGKATFVSLDRVPEMHPGQSIPHFPGVLGWASEIVRCEPKYRNMFRFLLDRVLVVADRAAGLNAVGNTVGLRCVTLDGEIVTGVGIAKGGSRKHEEGGAIGKLAQIEELQLEIDTLEHRIGGLRNDQEGLLKEQNAINIKAFQDEVKRIEKEKSSVEVRMAQLEFEKRRGSDVIAKTSQEISALRLEASLLAQEIDAREGPLTVLKAEKGEIERRFGGTQRELELLDQNWNALSKIVNELGVQVATLRGDKQNAQNELKRTDERIVENGVRFERLANEIQRAHEEIAFALSSYEENTRALRVLQDELTVLENRKKAVEDQVVHTREEIHRIEMAIKDARRQHDDSLEAMHDLELRIADLKAKSDHLIARALEEYEVSLELKSYPEGEFVDFAALRDEIQSLRDKIKSLGNINFAAFEEYTTEKQRLEFLTEQRKDLLEAEKTLLSTIEEINATAQRKFLETFSLIRGNFIETFKSLFDPGDECDLRLEEGVDPLEARIEITAKPRGKRPTSIDLLSGGEKTLTATALLFAIYLVKPSPFCILDEVDAPLDDANIDRFTRILKKFSNNTQFIVVTHNKRTMEAANALYGVTMEEEGVSKLVTVRFNRAGVRSAELISG
jgi:chromosome segregation protein